MLKKTFKKTQFIEKIKNQTKGTKYWLFFPDLLSFHMQYEKLSRISLSSIFMLIFFGSEAVT